MKQLLFLILSFVLIMFYSCKKEKELPTEEPPIVTVDPNIKDVIPVDLFVDSVSFIPLETTDSSLIAKIAKILFFDDLMAIHDYKTSAILLFDTKGHYLRNIGRKGQGPGEYAFIAHLMSDLDKKQIIAYDSYQRKMIYYDLDGNFIKEITGFSNNKVVRDVINMPDGSFICYKGDCDREGAYSGVWRVDSTGLMGETLYSDPDIYPVVRSNYFHSYLYYLDDNSVGLATEYKDDIFHIDENGKKIEKYMSFDIEGKTREKMTSPDPKEADYTKKTMVYEKGNYILTEWFNAKKNYGVPAYSLYSKDGKQTVVGLIGYYKSETLPTIYGDLINTNDLNDFVTIISPERILEDLNRDKVKEHTKEMLATLVAGKSEDEIIEMNPVIQILHLKKQVKLTD